jgi:predicted ester cyclase
MTREQAWSFANDWVAAWNAHDLGRILDHYEDTVELTSPIAAQLLVRPGGRVIGKADIGSYFTRGLEVYPDLRFELENVLCGLDSVVLYYINQKGTRTAEFMQLSPNGHIAGVIAHYSA